MINGMHGLFYAPNVEELRAFIRDKLGLVSSDIGDGWLIFDVPEADLGVHPSDKAYHSISFYCDDIHETVEALRSRGVEFSSNITDEGWGPLDPFSNARKSGGRTLPAKVPEAISSENVEDASSSQESAEEEKEKSR